jgi:hypothetical protein
MAQINSKVKIQNSKKSCMTHMNKELAQPLCKSGIMDL